MSSGNGSNYEKLIRRYLNGRIPAGVWFKASLIGGLTIVAENIYFHQPILQGFFSLLFWILLCTIPLFFVQAHVVGRQLQKKSSSAFQLMIFVLIFGWVVYACLFAWFLRNWLLMYRLRVVLELLFPFLSVMFSWFFFSVYSFRRNTSKN